MAAVGRYLLPYRFAPIVPFPMLSKLEAKCRIGSMTICS